MQMGLNILININKLTAVPYSTIDSSWTSNQWQMASREVAKREKRKIFSKKKEPLLMNLASSLANNSQAPPGYVVESQRLVF